MDTTNKKNPANRKSRAGRPKAADLKEGTRLLRTTVYLTEEAKKKLALYGLKQGMDNSAVIRMLIDTYL